MLTKKSVMLNFFAFYTAWWSILISNWKGAPVWGWLVFLAVMVLHFFKVSINKKKDVIEILIIGFAGIALDSILNVTGVITLNSSFMGIFPPLWLCGIWFLFASTISYSFVLIRNKIIAQVITGGFFAPVSYITGAKFGLLSLSEPFANYYMIHGACWLVFSHSVFSSLKK